MSPGAVRQGSSDSDPLVLEDVKAEDFERFLWVFYNPWVFVFIYLGLTAADQPDDLDDIPYTMLRSRIGR